MLTIVLILFIIYSLKNGNTLKVFFYLEFLAVLLFLLSNLVGRVFHFWNSEICNSDIPYRALDFSYWAWNWDLLGAYPCAWCCWHTYRQSFSRQTSNLSRLRYCRAKAELVYLLAIMMARAFFWTISIFLLCSTVILLWKTGTTNSRTERTLVW